MKNFFTSLVFCAIKRSCFYCIQKHISNQSDSVQPVKMTYKTFKDGNTNSDVPIIIMHGLFGSKANWSNLGVSIQKRTNRIVYTVDARNHGDSPHTDEHSYIHLAEDIKLFLSDVKTEKAALIGHSMGGRAAMVFALLYPQKVKCLIVVDISPIDEDAPVPRLNPVINALRAVSFKKGMTVTEARKSAVSQLTRLLGSNSLAHFLAMNVTENPKGNITWKLNIDAISKSYETHLLKFPIKTGEFKGPTLFVIGGESDFVDLEDIDKIKKLFPKASFEIIENTGHLVHIESPRMFLKIVCDFINKSTEKQKTT